jgi:hypothetical protein
MHAQPRCWLVESFPQKSCRAFLGKILQASPNLRPDWRLERHFWKKDAVDSLLAANPMLQEQQKCFGFPNLANPLK